MEEILYLLRNRLFPSRDNLPGIVDLFLVSFVLYRILLLIRYRRAWRILLGIFMFVLVLQLSVWFKLTTLHYLLDRAIILAPVALVILFLPEMRQTIEELGRRPESFIGQYLSGQEEIYAEQRTILELVPACTELAAQRIGAIIVLERSTHLDDVIATGTALNADVSGQLLISLFFGKNPLHDGAAVIRGNRVVAAACRLPLSDANLARDVHMRHRAAVGVTETSDAIALVVSEERGTISIASEGKLMLMSGPEELDTTLREYLRAETPPRRSRNLLIKMGGKKEPKTGGKK
ncbi:MAG: TIGR00159 family protein [Armatimonadetes bacterium]|nr:TIGR00159 family protein [Armatimonadota bacterium]